LGRVLRWLIGLPIAIIVIAFAVANRQMVSLSFDPLSQPGNAVASLNVPLWLLFFLGTFLGILLGWIGCWRAQGKWRKRARDQEMEIRKLSDERDALKAGKSATDMNDENALVPMNPGWI
jgi:hypothetical protein